MMDVVLPWPFPLVAKVLPPSLYLSFSPPLLPPLTAAWVGTRFICAKEAGAPPRHQKAVVGAGPHDTVRTIIFTGRPMRVLKNPYIKDWEENRSDEIKSLTSKGVIPVKVL